MRSISDLQIFDQLKADIAFFVAPTMKLNVSDFKSSQSAIDAAKQIKTYINAVNKKRTELVGPLNDQVKMVNAYAKQIEEPLLRAETYIKTQLAHFEVEQEKLRREEMRKAEEKRRESERQAEEDRKRVEAELESKRQEELAKLEEEKAVSDEAASFFGSEPTMDLDAERKRIDEESERRRLDEESRLERERIQREAQFKEETWDINNARIKNTRKNWKCEATDISLVPKEFLIVTLNDKAVLAAAKAGVQIPGVRVWQETSIAIGSNTYVPRQMLQGVSRDE